LRNCQRTSSCFVPLRNTGLLKCKERVSTRERKGSGKVAEGSRKEAEKERKRSGKGAERERKGSGKGAEKERKGSGKGAERERKGSGKGAERERKGSGKSGKGKGTAKEQKSSLRKEITTQLLQHRKQELGTSKEDRKDEMEILGNFLGSSPIFGNMLSRVSIYPPLLRICAKLAPL
jgi:hypothetical protein